MREWLNRLRDWLRRDRLDAELAEEMRFHREQLERDAQAAGVDPVEARYAAARQLGNVTRQREAARERWSIPWLDVFFRDVRYALRGLRRSPGFTATVILTLGLGIGANVAMFGVVDRLMYRPLAHLRDPGTVHRFYWEYAFNGQRYTNRSTEYTRYLDMTRWATSFSQLAAFSERDLAVGEGESSREVRVGVVSASYFAFFDARPALGRFFAPDEDVTPRGADAVVLSHAFWLSEFGGDEEVIGRPLRVGNVRAMVVGVAPRDFAGVNDANPPMLFLPITTYAGNQGSGDAETYFTAYDWGWINVLARRAPGVTQEQAEADATQAYQRSWLAQREATPNIAPVEEAQPRVYVSAVRPGAGPDPGLEVRTARWVSLVAVVVLLIACANIANLFLARALRRRREIAVRLALGVSRKRLLMQSMTESLVLALLGGVAAVGVAEWGGTLISHLLIAPSAPSLRLVSDGRALGVTFAFAVGAGISIGLIPALFAGRGDLGATLRGGSRGGSRDGRGIRAALLVVQASLSVALLVGATLFVRSLSSVKTMRMGYDAEQVLFAWRVSRDLPLDDSTQVPLRRLLLATAQALPDVESAAWVSSAPFISFSNSSLYVAGIDSVGLLGPFDYQATTPDYFRTMGTRIVRGRGFTVQDDLGAPLVAVVSEAMAEALWPGRDALGECFRMREPTAPCVTVIGIAENMVQRELASAQRFNYYLPIEQFTRTWGRGMVLRVRGDPAAKAEGIRLALQRVMPGGSYVTTSTLSSIVQDAQRSWRQGATMFTVFGALALVVAAVGLYGVIAYNVTERAHELSVRVALGAQRANLLRLVVGESVRYTLIGVGLGLLVAAWSGPWLQPLLFRQSARDPVVYAGIGLLMVTVALVASLIPALRASRSDPAAALRAE